MKSENEVEVMNDLFMKTCLLPCNVSRQHGQTQCHEGGDMGSDGFCVSQATESKHWRQCAEVLPSESLLSELC